MKKILKFLFLIFMAGIIFTACTGKDQDLPDKKIYNVKWTLESMIKTDDGVELSNDMALKFDKKNFVMTDRNSAYDYTGTYKLKKAGAGYEVIMKFDGFEEPVTGIYGMRTYKDKDPKPDLVFEHWDTKYSFIGEEKK
ncbi:hypothetical protein QP518_00310 [Peptoniphilus harei]|uniref:hypothetical protein n=1 Tax=Peptoniphilus harei TaxID=54005 RepID=UPI00254D5628|nr:hypothetical protein [Peptoniphilus harei]MDK7354186.1 hypothetical protein [Peptoniphilus harei]MDK7370186.1 hypothetical protein [Peptoniphilus harei]